MTGGRPRSRPAFWLLFAAMTACYMVMLIWTLPRLQTMAGGLVPFDLRPMGYTPDEARAFLGALGPDGAAYYLGVQQRLDTVYPALLALVLVFSFRKLAPGKPGLALAGLAIVAAVFDYAENLAVRSMLLAGDVTDAMAQRASAMTIAKSTCATVAFLALLILLVRAGIFYLRGRR